MGIVVVYSMSKQLGNGLVARAAECGGCDAVGCIGRGSMVVIIGRCTVYILLYGLPSTRWLVYQILMTC